jgi:glutathione peroxidase-family protein
LAFPCNQFGGQEPGTSEDIKKFAAGYNVKFDMFSKIDVNGDTAHPLWKYLKSKQTGTITNAIKWNYTKFIIDKNGQPVARHAATTDPFDMEKELLEYLNK